LLIFLWARAYWDGTALVSPDWYRFRAKRFAHAAYLLVPS